MADNRPPQLIAKTITNQLNHHASKLDNIIARLGAKPETPETTAAINRYDKLREMVRFSIRNVDGFEMR